MFIAYIIDYIHGFFSKIIWNFEILLSNFSKYQDLNILAEKKTLHYK
jgi:hypothetical protein